MCNNPISCISSYGNFCSTWIHALLCKRKVEISAIQSLMCKGISGVPWAQAMHRCQSVTREQCISDAISCATRCSAIRCAIRNITPSPLYFFWRLPAGELLKICDIDWAIWGPPMGAPQWLPNDCFDVDDNDNDDSDGDVDDDRKEEGSDGKAWLIPPRSIPQISHSCLPSSTIFLMMTIYI